MASFVCFIIKTIFLNLLCRWASLKILFDTIDGKVKALCNGENVNFREHIGGGLYVSVTSGFYCVDFRKFFVPYGQQEIKPTRKGIALRIHEWAEMQKTIDTINNDFPCLATALPCYLQIDHNSSFDCRECYPFGVIVQ